MVAPFQMYLFSTRLLTKIKEEEKVKEENAPFYHLNILLQWSNRWS